MDYIREMLNMSGNIMKEVTDAIDRGDYSNLSATIRKQVAGFTDGMRGTTGKSYSGNSGKAYYGGYNSSGYNMGGYKPVDIDLGTKPKGQQSQQRPGQQGYQQRPGQQGYGQQRPNSQYSSGTVGGHSASQFTGQQTGAGYNAGQAYDERRRQQAGWNYSAPRQNQGSTSTAITPFNANKPKNTWTNSTLKQVLGGTGLVFTVPAAVAMIVTAATVAAPAAIASAAVMAAGAGVSGYLTGKGTNEKKLEKIFDEYDKIIGGAEYIDIKTLAEKTNDTTESVMANLEKMIAAGMLPQARYDSGKTTVMLTQNAYNQYLIAEDARKEREAEEARLDSDGVSKESRKVIKEGEEFVAKIKRANELIPGEEMTEKLNQLERIVNKIFAKVKQEPESASDLRKFMNYYLPTTEKLMNAYIELDKQPEVEENIVNTKRDIEEAVDTINDAFENLLDSLFEETAWDISSDISVMKTMMEQDGLTGRKRMRADESVKDIVGATIDEEK
ncbi:MAG: 5-bromo-4-chloroindolyl phosphate hydrolysis family protein [Firmicutes bacterium]|nr:5-bromo-4-chloroindolyl phosphate hydrolysis family protein [Bacillota bacterium]